MATNKNYRANYRTFPTEPTMTRGIGNVGSKKRDPNDKTTYISRENQLKSLDNRREIERMRIQRDDGELWKQRNFRIVRKDLLAAGTDGSMINLAPYKTEMYKHYDGNNPALWQGGGLIMSTRALYGQKLDEGYKKVDAELVPGRKIPVYRSA